MSRTAVCAAFLLLFGSPAALSAPVPCPAALPSHLRVLDCSLSTALADALPRSATLQQLVDRIASLNGVIYVVFEPTPAVRKTLLALLSHQVTVVGRTTILRVSVRRNAGDAALATLAHEFRHAVELLEVPDARTERAIQALFERIGIRTESGAFETEAAVAVQRSVIRELHAAKRIARPF